MKDRLWIGILTLLVAVSLALNGILIFALFKVRAAASDALTSMRFSLNTAIQQPLSTTVHVDQEVPFNTIVPISYTVSIPLSLTYPLSTVFNTYIDLPVLGRQDLNVPIETLIPIQHDFTVPVSVAMPISLTYHLQVDVPVSFEIPGEIRAQLDDWLQNLEAALQ